MPASKKIILLFLASWLVLPFSARAQDTATNSATINSLRKAVQDKVNEKLKELTQVTSLKRAWQGTIKQIDPVSILLDVTGEDRNISLTETTVFLDGAKNKLDQAQFKIGQTVLILGYTKGEKELEAKRVILANPNVSQVRYSVIHGQIVDVSKSSNAIVIAPLNNKDKESQILIDTKTTLASLKQKIILYPELYKGQIVVAIVNQKDKVGKVFYAKTITALTLKPSPTPSVAKPTQNQ